MCELCGQSPGDVFALRAADDRRVLVCYRCYGEGLDGETLRTQAQTSAVRADLLASRVEGGGAPSVASPPRPGARDTGDMAWGFVIGFLTGLVGILALRLALSSARRPCWTWKGSQGLRSSFSANTAL